MRQGKTASETKATPTKSENSKDTPTKQQKGRKPLFYVALAAAFLLAGIGFSIQAFGGSPSFENGAMLPIHSFWQNGTLSAQVRSDQGGATESPAFVLIGNNSLVGIVPAMSVTPKVLGAILGETALESSPGKEIIHYEIEEGDTADSIAERFGISANTVLWANDLSASASLEPGDELIILPTSGALHLIRPGDTISEVALWYKANAQDILAFNDLDSAQDIFVGDILVVPGGAKPKTLPNGRLTPLANSYFIYPVPRSYKITQGLHPFNAIDFANGSCGGPAYAAAGGTAQVVGYNNGLGNYVRILHPNGVVTVYAHLSGHAVTTGQRVSQGEIIGYIGHTGRTIPAGPAGCHLHFEVRGATNPFR